METGPVHFSQAVSLRQPYWTGWGAGCVGNEPDRTAHPHRYGLSCRNSTDAGDNKYAVCWTRNRGTAIAGFGIEGCNGGFARIPPHDLVYFGLEDFATGLFLLGGLFEIGEVQLLAHRHSSMRWDDGF